MSKALRKLSLIPVLALVAAASLSAPRKADATLACFVRHFGCPEGEYDCCCGSRQACLGSSTECQAFCS